MAEKVKLTPKRVADVVPDPQREVLIGDTAAPGLFLRVRPTGGKTWVFRYRVPGAGRAGAGKRVTLGDATVWTLDEARREAARLRGEVADRRDPAEERREILRAQQKAAEEQAELDKRLRLSSALDVYETSLAQRGVRDRANVVSALRRRLLATPPAGLGDVPLEEIDRRGVMEIVAGLEASGMTGAARSLRQKASTFLNWATDRGHIQANPLAGMRRERATRAQRLAGTGRALTDEELCAVWRACAASSVNPVLGAIVRTLILTGQRRTETALMRWVDVDLEAGWWVIPAEVAKNGTPHEVPLTPSLVEIIGSQPRHAGCAYVFTNTGSRPVSGWSKLEPDLRDTAGLAVPWTLHDLRRSFRSGLTRLGADDRLAELMLNHRPADLRAVYDREPRLEERRRLAEKWADGLASHLASQVRHQPEAHLAAIQPMSKVIA